MRTGKRATLERWVFRFTVATISWNIVEAGVALGAGIPAGSVALTGFGLDSTIEVSSALFILWKLGGAPGRAEADRRERRARRGIALTFLALGLWIGWDSAASLLAGRHPDKSAIGIVLASLSLVIMPVLGLAKMRVGRALASRAIQADAVETLVCAYLSATLVTGLGLHALFGWWWADYAGALLMVPFLLWQARETWGEEEGRD